MWQMSQSGLAQISDRRDVAISIKTFQHYHLKELFPSTTLPAQRDSTRHYWLLNEGEGRGRKVLAFGYDILNGFWYL